VCAIFWLWLTPYLIEQENWFFTIFIWITVALPLVACSLFFCMKNKHKNHAISTLHLTIILFVMLAFDINDARDKMEDFSVTIKVSF
jgi:hypothetical protein